MTTSSSSDRDRSRWDLRVIYEKYSPYLGLAILWCFVLYSYIFSYFCACRGSSWNFNATPNMTDCYVIGAPIWILSGTGLFDFVEGPIGAYIMVVCGIGSILLSAFGKYFWALTVLAPAFILYNLRVICTM